MKQRMSGLTLLELMFGMFLLSMLFLLSFPAFNLLLCKNQLKRLENELTSAIHYARHMAVLEGNRLALTAISDDWAQGMILFTDTKDHKYHSGAKVFQRWEWNYAGLQISWKGFQSNSYLLFAKDLKHSATSGHFEIMRGQLNPIKLVVNRFGRVLSLG